MYTFNIISIRKYSVPNAPLFLPIHSSFSNLSTQDLLTQLPAEFHMIAVSQDKGMFSIVIN